MSRLPKLISLLLLCVTSVAGDEPRVSSVFTDRVPVVDYPAVYVQTHLYLSIVNSETRQCAFLAYHVRHRDFDTENVLQRNFHTPRHLRDVLLESSDYTGSGRDIGHGYALASVAASPYASEVNSFAALFAQTPELNRGPWLTLERRVRDLAEDNEVAVMVGQLWLSDETSMPAADEPHAVASHNWIWFRSGDVNEAYMFRQRDVKRDDDPVKYQVSPDDLSSKIANRWWVSD